MYNSLTRIQNVFGFFTSVAFVVAAIIAASDLIAPRTPSGMIEPTSVQVVKGRPHYYSTKKEEYAIIKFSLEADLSSLFTWNTKQVFVYVTAEWPSLGADGAVTQNNSAVIWDNIITSPSADHLSNMPPVALRRLIESTAGRVIDPGRGKFQLFNHKPKYQITHPSGHIAESSDVKLRLHYNVQPWVGALTWDQQGVDLGLWKRLSDGVSEAFALPPVKRKDDAKTSSSKAKTKTKSKAT
ncbi:signal peptidase subunit-domain-containing protein [Camillea tinctor]|nr:signal peptidase subunit-domain-containing protein [Camillea tinctor]